MARAIAARSSAPSATMAAMPARAFGARHAHAVDVRFGDAGKCRDRRGDFRGRDVLALPAEGVADPVDEIEKAACVPAHQIAGAKPGVARREHVAQDLLLACPRRWYSPRSGRRHAPTSSRIRPIASPASSARAADAEAARVARRRARRRHRISPAPAGSGAQGRAECGRWRRACPRRCRATRCLRSRRRIPGSAECGSASWNVSQTSARSPLPQHSRCRCARLARMRRRVDADSGTARRYTETACSPSAATSSQNCRAENFSRITTEPPRTSTAPVATTPPTL